MAKDTNTAKLEAEIEELKARLSAKPSYIAEPTACDLADYTEGRFSNAKGEVFALKTAAENEYGQTHFLKNNVHFWAGNKAQFRALFEKA